MCLERVMPMNGKLRLTESHVNQQWLCHMFVLLLWLLEYPDKMADWDVQVFFLSHNVSMESCRRELGLLSGNF